MKFIKNNLFNLLLVGILIIFLVTGKFNIIGAKVNAYFGESKGELAQNFIGSDILNSQKIQLSDLKGNPVLVNFWATWCLPCRVEIPSFIDLQKKYADKGLKVVGISVDRGDIEQVKKFVKEQKINYPVIMYDYQSMKEFGEISAVPTSFLINAQGKIEAKYPGYYLKNSFEKEIKKLLNN